MAAEFEPALSGGSQPANWCLVQPAIPTDPLTLAAPNTPGWLAADLQIIDQSGSDFSVATYDPGGSPQGAIISAAGGLFQIGAYIGSPTDAALDGGSSFQRYLVFGADSGVVGGLNSLGIDTVIPIVTSGDNIGRLAITHAGLPGVVLPGGPAFWNLFASLVAGFGTDSVPLDNIFGWPMVAVWQIA